MARRDRQGRATLIAAVVAAASLLLVLPFTGLDDYFRTLLDLGRTFDQDCYSLFGLLVQAGAPESGPRGDAREGAALLVCLLAPGELRAAESRPRWCCRRSCGSTTTPSPRFRSRSSGHGFAVVWLVPLVTWGLPSAGIGAGNAWGGARVLIVFTIVFAVIVRAEREATRDAGNHAATVRPLANRRLEPRSSPD